MLKYVSTLIISGFTLTVLVVVGVFSFLPPAKPVQIQQNQDASLETAMQAQQVNNGPTIPDTAQLEATVSERETVYQEQIAKLNQTLQERQSTYQLQIQQLNAQISPAEGQLTELKAQEQSLLAQVAELETTRAERMAVYQTQLQQAQNQFNSRYTQLQEQLTELQNRLAEANTQLGR